MIKIKETFSVLSNTGKGFQNRMLRMHGIEFVKTFQILCLTHIYLDSLNLFTRKFVVYIPGTPSCAETRFRVNLIGLFIHDGIPC